MKRTLSLAIASGVAFCTLIALVPMPASADHAQYRTSLVRWRGAEGAFSTWALSGTGLDPAGRLRLDESTAVPGVDPYPAGGYLGGNYYNAGSFVVGEAISPVTTSSHGFAEAITSWNADTPSGTWIEVQLRAQVDGRFTKFYNLGIWAEDSSTVQRHSVRAQGDADGHVAVDTVVLDKKLTGDAFQLKLRLFSAVPGAVPTVANSFVALSSTLEKIRSTPAGDPALWDRVLPVPECSQMVYPDGGNVWCSPTSTSMVMAYWAGDTGPCEPRVRAAVEGVWDRVYDGGGNWIFNTAYAATAGLEAHVARFTSLADAEPWIAAGVPVVMSYYWKRNSLEGAPIPTSDGHLAVLVGFDAAGNPIVNDPAAAADGEVQRTYLRSEIEDLWVAKSGGTAYLIHPAGHPVPAG